MRQIRENIEKSLYLAFVLMAISGIVLLSVANPPLPLIITISCVLFSSALLMAITVKEAVFPTKVKETNTPTMEQNSIDEPVNFSATRALLPISSEGTAILNQYSEQFQSLAQTDMNIPLDEHINHSNRYYHYSDGLVENHPISLPDNINELLKIIAIEYQTRHQANKKDSTEHVCIIGGSITGLFTALRTYAAGYSITLLEKRTDYTRKNVLRLSSEFVFGDDDKYLPHALINSIFLCDTREAEQNIKNQLKHKLPYTDLGTTINTIFTFGIKTGNADSLFAAEKHGMMHTITIQRLESILLQILTNINDDEDIRLHRNAAVTNVDINNSTVHTDTVTVTARWIMYAAGSNAKTTQGQNLLESCFSPSENHHTLLTTNPKPFVAARFKHRDQPILRSFGARLDEVTPAAIVTGYQQTIEANPQLENCVQDHLSRQNKPGNRLHHTLNQQEILYSGDHKKIEDHVNYGILETHTHAGRCIDLVACYHAIASTLKAMTDEFSWQRSRLPLTRVLRAADAYYLGMEISAKLFNELTNNDSTAGHKFALLKNWLWLTLEHFCGQDILNDLSIEEATAFCYQPRVSNHLITPLPNGGALLVLGDAAIPPFFLAGVGVESAAISVQCAIEYLEHRNPLEFENKIYRDIVQPTNNNIKTNAKNLQIFSYVDADTPSQEMYEEHKAESNDSETATPPTLQLT